MGIFSTFLINARVLIFCACLALLGFSNLFAYRAGQKNVNEKWGKENAKQIIENRESLLLATDALRKREKELTIKKQKVDNDLQREKNKFADYQRATANSLREFKAAISSDQPADFDGTGSTGGVDGSRIKRELLEECAGALFDVAAQADRLKSKVTGLQDYANEVCQSP